MQPNDFYETVTATLYGTYPTFSSSLASVLLHDDVRDLPQPVVGSGSCLVVLGPLCYGQNHVESFRR